VSRGRWPAWVYGEGTEPDARFSFANERTFLAWIRTSLAFLAAGVVLDALELRMVDPVQRALSVVLVLLGLVAAAAAWLRWALAERAMRRGRPLPAPGLGPVLVLGLFVTGIVLIVSWVA
jgi:putative membrane protein